MFDRVRGYTEFYFYFLLVAYGFSMKRRFVCDNCADSIFRKTLLRNLIFLLGVPSSIYLKLKSITGREPFLRELAKANTLARKGRYKEAAPIFAKLQSKYPEHPGLLLDEGMGYLMGKNYSGAVGQFNRALMSCNNYLPALRLMQQIQNPSNQAR
jgi:tetratricopeptide (TPR) repeat protein